MSIALPKPLFLLQEDFEAITDPRIQRTRLHKLADILLLSLAACCAGADGYEDIPVFCHSHGINALRSLLGVQLPNDIPHHDAFRRVLARIEPTQLQPCLDTLRKRIPQQDAPHIALDGKELRGSHDAPHGQDALRLLSVFATDTNPVIGQKKVDSKTNEIPVAQEVLSTLALAGATVTADALHCQVETATVIRLRKADYLLCVRENQKTLYDAMERVFRVNRAEGRLPMSSSRQVEKGHGRVEVREGFLIRVCDCLPMGDRLRVWPDWTSILCIDSERRFRHRGHAKEESFRRYFISSHGGSVELR